jgi:hypothetical protein
MNSPRGPPIMPIPWLLLENNKKKKETKEKNLTNSFLSRGIDTIGAVAVVAVVDEYERFF